MQTGSYLKYLLTDDYSLQRYFIDMKQVVLSDIMRSMMLIERDNNHRIPDHYYRLGLENTFEGIGCVSQVFTVGLRRLADHYLEVRRGIVYVKADKMNDWQLLLPYMPPLLMVCVRLWEEHALENGKETEYIHSYLLPNIRHTCYPSPYILQLEELLDKGGLTDLHMHLNGALETDLAWQDFLQNPQEILAELKKSYSEEKVKEQYAQLSVLAEPDTFYKLLKVASVIRCQLFNLVYGLDAGNGTNVSLEGLLRTIASGELYGSVGSGHPMEFKVGKGMAPQLLEGALYIKLLQLMSIHPENETVSCLFHYYLLILGLVNKLMVQQPTCYGFEEFQKVTLNGLREYSESQDYSKRFAQLSGNDLRHVRLLEGRFSPKDDLTKDETILLNIQRGWEWLNSRQESLSQLKLVAHFIKKKDDRDSDYIRHKNFRDGIGHKSNLLIQLKRNNTSLSNAVLGIDAAASEFDAPPEVFAQVYRKLRQAGFQHFTYHAGEDFFHILSGLRAIYEAITFLGLERCDRIGHATAAGVPVELWSGNVGERMLIRQGEHLDNLLFGYHLISKKGDPVLKGLLPILSLKIDELSYAVYQKYFPVSIHMEAWLDRYRNPNEIIYEKGIDGNGMSAEDVYVRYHQKDVVERCNKIIEIGTFDVFSKSHLTAMQLLLLQEMHDREIVIETLPTSNVIIGNHHDFSTYHLYNWYQWKKLGHPLPPIVVGTDDVGVFATNIYNEYCNIYCQFLYNKGMNSDEIVAFIKELDSNARHYAFT